MYEESTWKRGGRAGMQLGSKGTCGTVCGRDRHCGVQRGERNRPLRPEAHTGRMNPRNIWLWKPEGLIFWVPTTSGIQNLGFKKIGRVGSGGAGSSRGNWVPPLKKQHSKQPPKTQHRSSCMKGAWGTREGRLFTRWTELLGNSSGNKGTGRHHFCPLPCSVNTQPSAGTCYLTC